MNIAIWEKTATINPTKMLLKEKKYQGVITYARGDFKEVLEAISEGKISPEAMITKKVCLIQPQFALRGWRARVVLQDQ